MRRLSGLIFMLLLRSVVYAAEPVVMSCVPDNTSDSVYEFIVPEGTVSSEILLRFDPLKLPAGHGLGRSNISVEFCDSVSGVSRRLNVASGVDAAGGFDGQAYYNLVFSDVAADTVIGRMKVFDSRERKLFSKTNGLSIALVDSMVKVGFSRSRTDAVFPDMMMPTSVRLGFEGKVNIQDFKMECDTVEIADRFDMNALQAVIARCDDEIAGFYTYLDRENNPDYAEPGGFYQLAVVPDGDGYRIIYLGGAKVASSQWKPGMTKGQLTKTLFKSHFNLKWIDSAGLVMDNEQFASLDDSGTILELNFPLYQTRLRFRRVNQ